MTTAALDALARARAHHSELAVSLEQATQAAAALNSRLAEAKAKGEEAVRKAKASGDASGKWAMQLRLSQDDQADLGNLIAQADAAVSERTAALSNAARVLSQCEADARAEENAIEARELDAAIRDLDRKLCEAVRRRVELRNLAQPRTVSKNSCFSLVEFSQTLKGIVTDGTVA